MLAALAIRNIKAFSLVEAMVAGVVFTIAVAGVFASISSLKQPVYDNEKSVIAALCGQKFLAAKRAGVDGRDWAAGSSILNPVGLTTANPDPYCTQDGVNYTVQYQITSVGNARKVTVTVSWP